MKLFKCDCQAAQLTRIRREPWMRLVPCVRLFFCHGCRSTVLGGRNFEPPYFVQTSRWHQAIAKPATIRSESLHVASKGVAKMHLVKMTELRLWADTELTSDVG